MHREYLSVVHYTQQAVKTQSKLAFSFLKTVLRVIPLQIGIEKSNSFMKYPCRAQFSILNIKLLIGPVSVSELASSFNNFGLDYRWVENLSSLTNFITDSLVVQDFL